MLQVAFALLSVSPMVRLSAQEQPLNAGALFLVFPVGAQAVGMGQTAMASSGRGDAAFWNPAGLATIADDEFALHSANLVAGRSHVLGAYFPSRGIGDTTLSALSDRANEQNASLWTIIDGDILIPATLIGPAMNGDKVRVEITFRKPGGRAEGRIVDVIKRARETIVGQLKFDGQAFFVAPADEKLPAKILIPDPPSEHKDKIVEVEITRSGQMARMDLREEKEHPAFTDASMSALRSTAPFEALPADFPERTLILRIQMVYPKIRMR